MAKAGLILAILVWPIGLVLSVIALFKASKLAGVDLTQVTTQLQSTESSGILPEATQRLFLILNGDLGNIDQYCSN